MNNAYDASVAPPIQSLLFHGLGWPTISNFIYKREATPAYKFLIEYENVCI